MHKMHNSKNAIAIINLQWVSQTSEERETESGKGGYGQ